MRAACTSCSCLSWRSRVAGGNAACQHPPPRQHPVPLTAPGSPCTLAHLNSYSSCAFTQGDTPPELVNRWGCDTLDHYLGLYQSPEAPAAGGMARGQGHDWSLWGAAGVVHWS